MAVGNMRMLVCWNVYVNKSDWKGELLKQIGSEGVIKSWKLGDGVIKNELTGFSGSIQED